VKNCRRNFIEISAVSILFCVVLEIYAIFEKIMVFVFSNTFNVFM